MHGTHTRAICRKSWHVEPTNLDGASCDSSVIASDQHRELITDSHDDMLEAIKCFNRLACLAKVSLFMGKSAIRKCRHRLFEKDKPLWNAH